MSYSWQGRESILWSQEEEEQLFFLWSIDDEGNNKIAESH